MTSPESAQSGDLEARVDRLYRAQQFERLKHDAAFFSDIRVPDETRFAKFAALFGSGGKWDDGDGEGVLDDPEQIAAKLRTLPDIFGLKLGMHLLGSPRMDIVADNGSARWPMLCFVTSLDGVPGFVAGEYRERYGVRNGRPQIDYSVVEAGVTPAAE